MLLLLWRVAFAWALKDSSLLLVCTTAYLFPDMPCMKRVYRDKKASVHWSAARKKERFSSRR